MRGENPLINEYTEEQRLIQKTAREFAEKELAPHLQEWDEEEVEQKGKLLKLGELGFLGVMIPERLGGIGADTLTYLIALEEISAVDPSTAVAMSVHNSLPTSMVNDFGTEKQKEELLAPMARGEKIAAFALTEPHAGSDAASLSTAAERQGDWYILNGTKLFVSTGTVADVFLVFARTEEGHGAKGISAFLVDRDSPGLTVGKKEHKMGVRSSSTVEVVFESCKVPEFHRLGDEGEGFILAMKGLDGGRLGIATQSLGIARACLDLSIAYSRTRKQFNKPIAEFQAISFAIAEMATEIEAARSLNHRVARKRDMGIRVSHEASMAKLFASRIAVKSASTAVQIHGGYGIMKEYPVERFFRDAKVTELYEGTSEIQKLVISRALLRE
jgi:alkylation response protein AidB-like acyl-CoA dehydrogenase